MSCNIRAYKGSAQSFCSIFSWSELIRQYWRTCCSGEGRGNTETLSKLFANHKAPGQLTNYSTFSFSEGGPSSNPELNEPFVPGWGERYCNNVNDVKTYATVISPCSPRRLPTEAKQGWAGQYLDGRPPGKTPVRGVSKASRECSPCGLCGS